MRAHRLGGIAALAALSISTAAAGRCRLQQFPPLPVTMENLRPLVPAEINGTPVKFILDSGAFSSMLSPAAANEFHLPMRTGPFLMGIEGTGGVSRPFLATVKTFTIFGYSVANLRFLVAGNDYPGGAVGLLGENVLRLADVEYDLVNGVVHLIHPVDCGDKPLAYWALHQPVSMLELEPATETHGSGWIIGQVTVNGVSMRALFDTGAPYSILSRYAAGQAGAAPGSPGVKPAGLIGGIGPGVVRVWTAPIDKIQIGTETVERTHMFVGNIDLPGTGFDMILGSDFFLSHHIYVANSQDRMYLTYNGGPIFNLDPPQLQKVAQATSRAQASATATPAPAHTASAKMPTTAPPASATDTSGGAVFDADAFMRRGMAYAARKEYVLGLAELTRACQLAPKNADYFYERGTVYWQSRQPDLALKDFGTAIALRPDDFRARFARASLILSRENGLQSDAQAAHAEVGADLDAIDRLAPPEANLRLSLAGLYDRIGHYDAAIRQYDQWIEYHLNDGRLPLAWNGRCWARAEANQHLEKALKDCNRALDRVPKWAAALDSRGLVYLHLAKPGRAIEDYSAAIKNYRSAVKEYGSKSKQPSLLADSLYGRGLAELRRGDKAKGQADLAAAEKLYPGIAKRFTRMGLNPR